MKPITAGQIKKIYATARQMGIDNDLLHAITKDVTGKEHISELNVQQAARVIDRITLKTEGERSINLATGRKADMASAKQMWKIRDLARQLGWKDNPRRLKGFVKKYAGVDNPDWMTAAQAWRIIEGLKSLLKQQDKSQGGGECGCLTDATMDT